ncbi:hypothetical protein [Suttonella ornithocola]|uniref:Integrating conjugative element protein PilL, PFGI-1 class n=1 Tax=Suttonella ornithocola TaxID=279832 RepID=A0A380MYU2_9GAMM|nr:hypothetical protein [Suttonella ornithocola]SUO96627.1 integrating conjugative element protein PilL, PFGI-1 class [Suttonella ornithocola]
MQMQKILVGFIGFVVIASSVEAKDLYGKGYTIISESKSSDDLQVIVYKNLNNGTVKAALEELLLGTGWKLADEYAADPMIFKLYNQSLPEQKQHLGPIQLNDALVWIGGNAWQLIVDPVNKLISYEVKAPYRQTRKYIQPNNAQSEAVTIEDINVDIVETAPRQKFTPTQKSEPTIVMITPDIKPIKNSDLLRISIPAKTSEQNGQVMSWSNLTYKSKEGTK